MQKEIVKLLKNGYPVVFPSDTLYGIHTPALNKKSVENVYEIRGRAPQKPFIILISSLKQLKIFKVRLGKEDTKILNKYWPGKVTIILPCPHREFEYLHRGLKTLAFRIPKNRNLQNLISKVGPLISTSVNLEGEKPAKTIKQAKKYFGGKIKFYLDKGKIDSLPSTMISLNKGKTKIVRQGEVKIDSK